MDSQRRSRCARGHLVLLLAALAVISSCRTVAIDQQAGNEPATPPESSAPPPAADATPELAPTTQPDPPSPGEPVVDEGPGDARAAELAGDLLRGISPRALGQLHGIVRFQGVPLAVWLDPVEGGDAWLVAIVHGDRGVGLLEAQWTGGSIDSRGARVRRIAPPSEVTGFRYERLTRGATRPNAVVVQIDRRDSEEEFLIVAAGDGPAIVRDELSALARATLRDLDGDGQRELVRYSRVFAESGQRELIVEAFTWRSGRFVPAGTATLVAAVNDRLAQLTRSLERLAEAPAQAQAAIARFAAALEPLESSPPLGDVVEGARVFVPPISELPVPLGEERWVVTHELVIETLERAALFRITIEVIANPMAGQLVRIVGLD